MSSDIPQQSEGTILRRLLSGSAYSMANLVLAVVVGLILSPYVIHTLGDRLFGMWALVGTLTGWYGMLDFGISGAVGRYITVSFTKGDKDGVNSYASIGYLIFTTIGILGFLISVGVSFFVRWLYPDIEDIGLLRFVIVVLGVNFAIDFPLRVYAGIISGCLRSDLTGRRSLIFRILSAVLTFLVLYSGGRLIAMSLQATFLALTNMVVFYWMARAVFPELKLRPSSIHKEHVKPLFSYSIFTAFTQIMDLLKFRMNNVFVAAFITLEMVTHYTIYTTLSSYGLQVIQVFTGWLGSWFTRLDAMGRGDDVRNHLMFACKFTVYLGTFITFGLTFWSIPFITRWVGAQYLEIYDTFLLMRFPVMLVFWTSVSVQYLYATAKHYYYAAITIVDTTIYLTVLFFTINHFGILALSIGATASGIVTRIFLLPIVICRLTGISFVTYWYDLTCHTFKSTICLLAPYFITLYLAVPEYRWLFLNGAVCAFVYAISIYFVGFTKDERRKVLGKLVNKPRG